MTNITIFGNTIEIDEIAAKRNMRGDLQCKTRIPLKSASNRELHLTTHKGYRKTLVTDATVGLAKREHGFESFEVCMAFAGDGDYIKSQLETAARGTEKAIVTQHKAALELIENIIIDAELHYAEMYCRKHYMPVHQRSRTPQTAIVELGWRDQLIASIRNGENVIEECQRLAEKYDLETVGA